MPLRETGDTNPETAPIPVHARLVKPPDKPNKVYSVLERIARWIIRQFARTIASQRENVPNPGRGITSENLRYLLFVVADAGQMRGRLQLRCMLNPLYQSVRQLARRTS